jgi:hypothetical protein
METVGVEMNCKHDELEQDEDGIMRCVVCGKVLKFEP